MSGRSSGSGTYSYHETSSGRDSVLVSHMPEDTFQYRIIFRHNCENQIPTLQIDETAAQLLWKSLNGIAEDMKWKKD